MSIDFRLITALLIRAILGESPQVSPVNPWCSLSFTKLPALDTVYCILSADFPHDKSTSFQNILMAGSYRKPAHSRTQDFSDIVLQNVAWSPRPLANPVPAPHDHTYSLECAQIFRETVWSLSFGNDIHFISHLHVLVSEPCRSFVPWHVVLARRSCVIVALPPACLLTGKVRELICLRCESPIQPSNCHHPRSNHLSTVRSMTPNRFL